MRCLRSGILSMALAGVPLAAFAHEEPFSYVKGAQVEPKGEWEIVQWTTARIDKDSGHYLGIDFNTELEVGLTDRLQAAVYLNSHYHDIKNAVGGDEELADKHRFGIGGASLELKYQVLSPVKDPIGFALYFEPGYDSIHKISGERLDIVELELKFIAEKHFFDGRLITAANYIIDPEWKRKDGEWELGLEMEGVVGASWQLSSHWRVGLETRLSTEFEDANLNESEYLTLFIGPNLNYTRNNWFGTLTVLPQVWGWPDQHGTGGLHLDERERVEVRLKVGCEF